MRIPAVLALVLALLVPLAAAAKEPPLEGDLQKRAEAALAKGRAFLVAQQDESGGWGDPEVRIPPNSGYTAMAVMGVVAATPRDAVRKEELVLAGLRFLASQQADNGAVTDNPRVINYFTSVAVGAWADAKVPAFRANENKGRGYLAQSQIAGDPSDLSYGGFPYGSGRGDRAADLSNTSMAASALHDAGLEKDSPVWQRLQQYLRRVQSDSEVNDTTATTEIDGEEVEVVSGNDGGAIYYPGNSSAGYEKRPDGKYVPRSYGSMSYALLKCLLFAGVPPDDPRVQKVVAWIGGHWTLERNPGFEDTADPENEGQQGWFYYVHTAARALAEYERYTGKPFSVVDAEGKAHDWRREIVEALLARQAEDGSWRNDKAERWEEGSKVLATGFALQTLGYATNRLP